MNAALPAGVAELLVRTAAFVDGSSELLLERIAALQRVVAR
jgi:hypothetical protein